MRLTRCVTLQLIMQLLRDNLTLWTSDLADPASEKASDKAASAAPEGEGEAAATEAVAQQ